MAPRIKLRRVYDSPYDVRVTDLDRPMIPKRGQGGRVGDGFVNRNVTNTTNFQLVANTSLRALPRNPRRVGLRIQNLDAATNLVYSLGNDLGLNGLVIPPGGSDLYDFTTPPDEIYLISTANILVIIADITRGYDQGA